MGASQRDDASGEKFVHLAHLIWNEGTLMTVAPIQDQTMFDLEDRAFLKHAYRQLLGRVPDAQGLRGYLEQLQAGASKQAIYEALASSDEARAHTAKTRAPSGSGLPRLALVASTVPVSPPEMAPEEPTVPAVARLDELLALDGQVFLRAAYLALLAREADDHGLQNYLGLLRDGWSKMHVLQGLAGSEEGRAAARSLPGLKMALTRYAKAQRRSWLGWYHRSVLGVESDMPMERLLRATHAALRRG